MKVRKFPSETDRVETGALQFGDDGPGFFLQGQDALSLGHAIDTILRLTPQLAEDKDLILCLTRLNEVRQEIAKNVPRKGKDDQGQQISQTLPVSVNPDAKIQPTSVASMTSQEHTQVLQTLDTQMAKLEEQFVAIVRSKSFAQATPQGQQDLAFVCFFVQLVALRYLGLRAGELAQAKLQKNIFFGPDGAIEIVISHFMQKEPLRIVIGENRRATHGMLMDALRLYHQEVYPYLIRKSGNTLGDAFFVAVPRGNPRQFKRENSARDFREQFRVNLNRFLDLAEFPLRVQRSLHPAYLRFL